MRQRGGPFVFRHAALFVRERVIRGPMSKPYFIVLYIERERTWVDIKSFGIMLTTICMLGYPSH